MAQFKQQYSNITSTTTETDFAGASDVDSIVNITAFGPANWGDVVEFKLYAKRDPAQAAIVRDTLVLNGPITHNWILNASLQDGWRVTHKKLSSGSNPTVSLEIVGVQ